MKLADIPEYAYALFLGLLYYLFGKQGGKLK